MTRYLLNEEVISLDDNDWNAPFLCLICGGLWNIEDGAMVDNHLMEYHRLWWLGLRTADEEGGAIGYWIQKQRVLR